METPNAYTAFEGDKRILKGALPQVILGIKKRLGKAAHGSVLIFSDATGNAMDFNFQGSEKEVLKRLEPFIASPDPKGSDPGPGRPRLGVIAREVLLLPRQWEWLASRSGGASSVLRGLVDEAMKKSAGGPSLKQVQERTYKFMHAMAGDAPGYEEALRALYKKDAKGFAQHTEAWAKDVRAHARELAKAVFDAEMK